MIYEKDVAINSVIEGLNYLILSHAKTAACEQDAPRANADMSDEIIKRNKEDLAKLRTLREQFENIVTGVL